ncbi:MAG: ABC transporter permease, partial [Marinobacter sp. 34-60-7]
MVTDSNHSSPTGPETAGQLVIENGAAVASGHWTLDHYPALQRQIQQLPRPARDTLNLCLSGIDRLDTAGASVLVRYCGAETVLRLVETAGLRQEQRALLAAVAHALTQSPPAPQPINPWVRLAAGTGEKVTALATMLWLLAGFIGQTLAALMTILPRPSRWRWTAFVAAVHDTGLNALPIVALLTFLVGAVVAFLGATVLEDFGATIYTVNLVAFSFLREFGVLLAAILLAG